MPKKITLSSLNKERIELVKQLQNHSTKGKTETKVDVEKQKIQDEISKALVKADTAKIKDQGPKYSL